MQILARPHNDKVGVPQVDVCIRGFKGVQFVYIPMDAYILYMQVLHGCLAVADLVSYRYLYM